MWSETDPDMQLTDDERLHYRTEFDRPHMLTETPQRYFKSFILPAAASIASLGGILFGYDIGIISGALLQLQSDFSLSCHQQEMIVATLIIGALVASICGGYLLDWCGRRVTIISNAFIFMVGAIILASSHSFSVFIFGRFVIGFSVSLSAIGDCIYISEIAPPKWRGMLVSMNEMGITMGILMSYFVNYLFVNVHEGWRYMFALSIIPAVLQVIGMLFLPSSPRWLVNKGCDTKAVEVIQVLWPKVDALQKVEHLKNLLSIEKKYRLSDLFTKRENLRMRMFIGCGIVFFQQLSGQPTVLYYAPVLFQTLGYSSNVSATLATVGLGVVKVIFTFITLCTVDKLGRRTFILLGATIMTISLVTLSGLTVSFKELTPKPMCNEVLGTTKVPSHFIKQHLLCSNSTENLYNSEQPLLDSSLLLNCSWGNQSSHDSIIDSIPESVKISSLCALMLFVIGYSVGYGPMSWLLLSELFPTGVKGRAVGLVSTVNWGTNMLLSMTFLDMIGAIGPFWIFLIYALIGVLSIFFLFQFVPETKGKSLELLNAELNQAVDIPCTYFDVCSPNTLAIEGEDGLLMMDHMETSEVL